jgi:hypothetical protein
MILRALQMKGLFLTLMNMESSPGYAEKVYGQVNAFRDAGMAMDIISMGNDYSIVLNRHSPDRNRRWEILREYSPGKMNGNRVALLSAAAEHIQLQKVQFLYLRYPISDPLYLFFLRKVNKVAADCILFSEIPTYPYDRLAEFHTSIKKKLLLAIDKICRRYIKRYIDRIVSIDSKEDIFGIPTISIQNGISIDHFQQVSMPRTFSPLLKLLGVANLMDYHGFDRVVDGMQNRKDVEFHIVGPSTPALVKLQEKVNMAGLSDQVIFHGTRFGTGLNELFNTCNIAVGCLAWHRAGLDQASNLKSREYMARGIPFMYSGKDIVVSKATGFSLQVPLTDDPIDFDTVYAFYEDVYNETSHPQQMRSFAAAHMSWAKALEPVLEELDSIYNKQRQRAHIKAELPGI